MLRRGGHDRAHRRTALAQSADQIEALIGRDPARNDQQDAPVVQQVDPPPPFAASVCYPSMTRARAIAVARSLARDRECCAELAVGRRAAHRRRTPDWKE